MNTDHVAMLDVLRGQSKAFVARQYPEEAPFFDTCWDMLAKRARGWLIAAPPAEANGAAGAATALGFIGEETLDLAFPKQIAAVLAAFAHLAKTGRKVNEGHAEEALALYARVFKLDVSSAKGICAAFGKNLADAVCTTALKEVQPTLGGHEPFIFVIVRGERRIHPGTSVAMDEHRKKLETFTIFVDDLDRKVWVQGEQIALKGLLLKLLVFLTANAGTPLDIEDILSSVWGPERGFGSPHKQAFSRLRAACGSALKDLITVDRTRGIYTASKSLVGCVIFQTGYYPFLDELVLKRKPEIS